MNINFIPILVVPAVPYEGGIRFLHRENQIDIGSEMASSIWKILGFCNGYTDVSSIAKSTGFPNDEVMEILSELEEMELIVDARYQFMHFHRVSNYPTAINSGLTQEEVESYTKSKRLPVKSGRSFDFKIDQDSALFSIRAKRRSCRSFSDKKLTGSQISSICHYAYSIPDHSVPSGGALYPLRIYVLIEEPQDGLAPGYYEYNAEQNRLVLFNDEVDVEQLRYCFNQEEMPFGSSVQIVIAADLDRQPYKYANRGYRLTLIEVGHVAENIGLYVAEQGLGACEMGGVQDEPLKQELDLDANIWPLIAIPVGYPAEHETEQLNKIRFVEGCVGGNHPVKQVWTRVFGNDGSFFGATTTYLDATGNTQYAGATSPSYADAVFKATIEGYERFYSNQVRVDFHGSANQIHGAKWLDPKLYFPLTEEQARKSGVKPFTKDLVIDWTSGTDYDGAEILVPSDLVYYGQKDSENRIYYGHSSGIAAHFDLNEAKKRAVVELIERDALMCSWFAEESPYILDTKVLPVHARKRIVHWAHQDRKMIVLQVQSDFGMVFETVIVSNEYPCFVSGASATIDNDEIESVILKSVQEAEYNLLLALRYPDTTPISPEKVLTPADHGKVYYFQENAEKLRWLYEGGYHRGYIEPITVGDFDRFCSEHLRLTTVNLSRPEHELKVIRVFSPYLVPINFGFNTAHFTHPIVKHSVGTTPGSLIMPHYFA